MKKKISAIVLYFIAFVLFVTYIALNFIPNFSLSEIGRLILLCGSSLFLYCGGVLLSKSIGSKKPLKINLWIFMILYLLLFLTLTLFDPAWGRNGGIIPKWSMELWNQYITDSLNVIPFKTIFGYIHNFDSLLSTRIIFFNLIGNLICLMPLAFFLPLLFPKQKNWKIFLMSIILFVLVIEGLQFLTLSGSCDIDDVILNVLGAFTLYQILKIPTLQNAIQNIFLLEKNKIDKRLLFKIGSLFLFVILIIYVLFWYRESLYQKNLKKLENHGHYSIQIVDESSTCADALEPFYEDELYIYNFSYIKSDSVYAKINDQKYLVKDILKNNPTKYPISIEDLSTAGLEFIKENKYEMISVEEKGKNYQIVVEDQNLLEVKISNLEYKKDKLYLELHFVPKIPGKTIVKIEFLDGKQEQVVATKNYQLLINDNLEVLYQIVE